MMMTIVRKPKHPPKNKIKIQGTKWQDSHSRRQMNHLRTGTQEAHQVPKPPPVVTSISNKEGELYTQAYSTASVYIISTLTLVHIPTRLKTRPLF
jgi:hypothetical protein